MIRNALRAAAAATAAALGGQACAAAPPPAPVAAAIDVHARAIAPGEPLRLEVALPEPATSLSAEFLGQAVFLVPDPDNAAAWSGWALVPLDGASGSAAVDVRGATADGRSVTGTLALTIEPREFPEERLAVASEYVAPPKAVERRIAEERERVARVYARRTARSAPVATFVAPVAGGPTSVFGTRRVYNGEPRPPHPGLDLRAASGTPVRAAGPGEVALAAELYFSGVTIILDHGAGLFTVYAHLSKLRVAEGASIEAGQVIALSGATGRVTGPHLHWGAKIGDAVFDPSALLDARLFGRPDVQRPSP